MKILFYGDSITDMGRRRDYDNLSDTAFAYGVGYPVFVAGELMKNPECEIVNRGIAGNKIVDLYARAKIDAWNHTPDVMSILVGVNDVWHEVSRRDGVELERWIRVYKMLIEDTKKHLPNVKLLICEPFILDGVGTTQHMDHLIEVKKYAAAAKQIAEEYGAYFLPLQELLTNATAAAKPDTYLYDGIHPTAAGAKLIADAWLKLFRENIENK